MERSKYEKIFARESERYLNDLESLLLQAEKEPEDRDCWKEVHGKIHSIKGMALALGIEKIITITHLMEEWCKLYTSGMHGAVERICFCIWWPEGGRWTALNGGR